MSHKQSEDLSALVDGELVGSEARFLIRRLNHDEELAARWRRYHLTKAVLCRRVKISLSHLSEQVALAIAEEPTPRRHGVRIRATNWLKPAIGLAIAASVGMAAFNYMRSDESAVLPLPAFVDKATPVGVISRPEAQFASGEVWSDPRVQTYVLRHNAIAAPRRAQGLSSIPYVYSVRLPRPQAAKTEQISVDE